MTPGDVGGFRWAPWRMFGRFGGIAVAAMLVFSFPSGTIGVSPVPEPVVVPVDARPISDLDATNANVASAESDYVPGEVLVGLRPGLQTVRAQAARAQVGASLLQAFSQIHVQRWTLSASMNVPDAVRILSSHPDVRYAEPNYLFRALDFPNDPKRNDLYGMHNLGQTGGTTDADIDALEAWVVRTAATGVVVGVIDTGVDYNHEDLVGNIWTNPGEDLNANGVVDASDFNGIDDDGNGKVDDLRGWDCINEDNDPMDDNNHGTHVSGTIGGVGNNGIGVVGVTWTVKIMPLKFLGAGGSGSTADAIECINYAASFVSGGNKVVRITSNSWGGGRRSTALQNAIAASGALFVASAGNSGSSAKQYPAGYDSPNIISVAATDHSDGLWSGSNYGTTWVDLGAPGVNVLSSIRNNGYSSFTGTSMACPHVSGAAALVLAANPIWTNDQVKGQILNTVDSLPSLSGKVLTGGRLNVRAALGAPEFLADTTAPSAVADLAATGTTSNTVSLSWTAPGDDGAVGQAYLYDVRYIAGGTLSEGNWATAAPATGEPVPMAVGSAEAFTLKGVTPGTTYSIGLKAADEAGNVGALSNVVRATTAAAPWEVQIVEAGNGLGFYQAHAYDPTGKPAVAYSDVNNDDVRFAHWNGASWDIEIVDAGMNVNTGIDIAYSPVDDRASISYGWGKLKFAHRGASGGWTITIVESKNAYNDVTSLAYASDGGAAISYRTTGQNGALKFARQNPTTGAWTTQVVEAGAGARYSALALDSAGNPAIAYSDDIDKDNWLDTLKFARWTGSSWFIQIVETGAVGFGVLCTLAYNPVTGNPGIVTQVNGVLRFAEWNGASWTITVIGTGYGPSLRYDSLGTPLVSFSGDTQIQLASRIGGVWQFDLVDTRTAQWRTNLKLDPTGKPSVSYGTGAISGASDIRYARKL